jgi:hypothetical protein
MGLLSKRKVARVMYIWELLIKAMKISVRILLLLLIILFGTIAIKIEFGPYRIEFFGELKYLASLSLFICSLLAFLIDWNQYRKNRQLKEVTVTCIALLFIAIIFYRYLQRTWIENQPTIVKLATLKNNGHPLIFEFKKGGNFKLHEKDGANIIIYYGRYKKTGNEISITSSNYHGQWYHLPKKGDIKNDTMYWNTSDTMVVEH